MTQKNRGRLAWTLLLLSFSICLLATISLPLGYRALIQNARRPLELYAQSNGGTLVVLNPSIPLSASDPPQRVDVPARFVTNNVGDSGLLQIYAPGAQLLFGRIQIFGNSSARVERAVQPRFAASSAPARISVALDRGRIQLTLPAREADSTALEVTVSTEHGQVLFGDATTVAIETGAAETQVSVIYGTARLLANGSELLLAAEERGVLAAADVAPRGPFDSARNLLRNGNFADRFSGWIQSAWNIERADQPSGNTDLVEDRGENVLRWTRNGIGHADNLVRQNVDHDVTGFSELRLLVTLRIWQHSLPVCGSLGTECPLTVRVDYIDQLGRPAAWQQGFYVDGEVSAEAPNFCLVCGPPLNLSEHLRIDRFGEVVLFESENLLTRLEQEGFKPSSIRQVSVIAAGHSFEVDVLDVALIARE